MFSKILIANRGEIAVRIIRACKEMGIATVAIYSQADKEALHVALADESYCVGGASPADSYLNEERVIAAALVSGAQGHSPRLRLSVGKRPLCQPLPPERPGLHRPHPRRAWRP